MTHETSAPLTPSDCDLRDFAFMPVDIVRLFGSKTTVFNVSAEAANSRRTAHVVEMSDE